MEKFKASVQYNDKKGSVAADRADQNDATSWLLENGHIQDDDFVVGVKLLVGENHGEHRDPVSVTFYISKLEGNQNIGELINNALEPLPVHEIRIDMPISQFLSLYKRLEITLSSGGALEGKDIRVV